MVDFERCDACTGPTREACDAVFIQAREGIGRLFGSVLKNYTNQTLIGLFDNEDELIALARKTGEQLGTLNCGLDSEQLRVRTAAEYYNAVIQVATEVEQAQDVDTVKSRTNTLLELLGSVDSRTEKSREEIINNYCKAQDKALSGLSYIEKVELSTRLKSMGLDGLF